MPRVVVLHSSDEMYGADRMLLQVLASLRALELEVEVWLPNDLPHGEFRLCEHLEGAGYSWKHVGLPILRRARIRPRRLPTLLFDWIRICRLLRRARPQAVVLGTSAALLAAPAAWLVGVPSRILHIQELWAGTEGRVLRLLARPTTLRIAISAGVAQAASLQAPHTVVVPNCVDDAAARMGGSAMSEVPERRLCFLVASRWNRWKGHRTLLAAWGAAGCPGRLVVLGGPPSTGDGVDIRQLVADLVDQPETVEVVGEVADIAPYVAATDVVIVPSDEPEPFGLIVIEAFSLGRPVVASDAGGPAEIIENSRTGWLYRPGDSEQLGRILQRLTRDAVVAAGRRARTEYELHYQPDRYRARIAELLAHEILESQAPRRRA